MDAGITRESPQVYKRGARQELFNAVRRGDVIPARACESCGHDFSEFDRHGHHEDYTKPLDVRWLCVPCHRDAHSGNGAIDMEGLGRYVDARMAALREFEIAYVVRLLDRAEGNIRAAADAAGMDRATIYRILERSGRRADEWRP